MHHAWLTHKRLNPDAVVSDQAAMFWALRVRREARQMATFVDTWQAKRGNG